MRRFPFFVAATIAAGLALSASGDVVVLKGGTVIPLKQAVVRRGNTAYITRTDGTLLSVPASEIDRDATAAANRAAPVAAAPPPAPATNPADAARNGQGTQKARVRITDADVSHPLDLSSPEAGDEKKKEEGSGTARVEVADSTREKNGSNLIVKGTLRNPGQGPAENVRLAVSAVDEKGQAIDGANATLSKGTLDSGSTIEFTATLNVGEKNVASLRFQPQWTLPKPPPAPPGQAGNGGVPAAAAAEAAKPPQPVPTPYGRGNLYAAPVANAATNAPSDSHTGYLPGASHPDNQPKPPQ